MLGRFAALSFLVLSPSTFSWGCAQDLYEADPNTHLLPLIHKIEQDLETYEASGGELSLEFHHLRSPERFPAVPLGPGLNERNLTELFEYASDPLLIQPLNRRVVIATHKAHEAIEIEAEKRIVLNYPSHMLLKACDDQLQQVPRPFLSPFFSGEPSQDHVGRTLSLLRLLRALDFSTLPLVTQERLIHELSYRYYAQILSAPNIRLHYAYVRTADALFTRLPYQDDKTIALHNILAQIKLGSTRTLSEIETTLYAWIGSLDYGSPRNWAEGRADYVDVLARSQLPVPVAEANRYIDALLFFLRKGNHK